MPEFKPIRTIFFTSNISKEDYLDKVKKEGGRISSRKNNKETSEVIFKTCFESNLQNCAMCVYKGNCENPVTG